MIGTWLIGSLVPNVDQFTTMDQALIRYNTFLRILWQVIDIDII